MPRIVKEHDVPRGASEHKYPWDEWFDGQWRELMRGTDFWCTPESFAGRARLAAQTRGKKIQTRTRGNTVFLRALATTGR